LAAIYDGASRTEVAQTGTATSTPRGRRAWSTASRRALPPWLADDQRAALVTTIEVGLVLAGQGMVRWRLIDLGRWLGEESRVSVTKQTLT